MGYEVKLQDEWGGQLESVADPHNILDRLFPEPGDSAYPMLGSIDPYSDTVFNGLQMKMFLAELAEVMVRAKTPEELNLVLVVENMAKEVEAKAYLFLKFVGE